MAAPPESLSNRLGYLLKHAQLQLVAAADRALAPFGIDGRELAILVLLAAEYPLSQQDAAARLGVDRTTMVALVDALEDKGLVARVRSTEDRRKNIVEPTQEGQRRLHAAEAARDAAEREFLSPLDAAGARQLVEHLQAVVLRNDRR
jgi:DNA-binding MarR family transcriptional regulator